jgi:urease accessory protein
MIYLRSPLPPDTPATRSVTLTFDERRKIRHRVVLSDGTEAALLLPRGTVLRDGDKVGASDRTVVEVRAASEELSVATTDDTLLLTRVAYHLGNRHVPLSISPGKVCYEHDHVLDDLVRHLGLQPSVIRAPFDPEAGSYSHSHHEHAHH